MCVCVCVYFDVLPSITEVLSCFRCFVDTRERGNQKKCSCCWGRSFWRKQNIYFSVSQHLRVILCSMPHGIQAFNAEFLQDMDILPAAACVTGVTRFFRLMID